MVYHEDIDHDVPAIPDDLIAEFYRNNVIIFTGSGISSWALDDFGNAAPSWGGLLTSLVKEAERRNFLTNPNRVSELTHLIGSGRIDDMLIAANYIVEKYRKNNEDLSGLIFEILSAFKRSPLLESIAGLPCRGFITTNYDSFVEDHFKNEGHNLTVLSASNDLTLKYIESNDRPWLVKLHGRIGFSSRFVLSYDQYEQAYSDGSLNTLLSVLMSKYTILFLGFGFRDPPIMEAIREVARRLGPAKRRHYAISDSSALGAIKSRFLKEHFDIVPIVYKISDSDLLGRNDGHQRHKNFPKTVKALVESTDPSILLSTRVLFAVNHPENDFNKPSLTDRFLTCELLSNPISDVIAPILFPSIEWTQLLFSELKNLKRGNYRALKLDICEHFNIESSNIDKIEWHALGAPFWDRRKPHLSTGIQGARFYFQFSVLKLSEINEFINPIDLANKFDMRDMKYKYYWKSAQEMLDHINVRPDDYNAKVIRTFLDLLEFNFEE